MNEQERRDFLREEYLTAKQEEAEARKDEERLENVQQVLAVCVLSDKRAIAEAFLAKDYAEIGRLVAVDITLNLLDLEDSPEEDLKRMDDAERAADCRIASQPWLGYDEHGYDGEN